ncbi:hypothetical protein HCN44_000347 [Aphidius gifuensis]|uniref:Uncharacterized protein n=1 Tax=Aphidius gifuensis TaxID=684658 RepID=A0A835CNR5_APHGI|nr:hypothetical protein HCN44_000347 [Aphidius gifuensis]
MVKKNKKPKIISDDNIVNKPRGRPPGLKHQENADDMLLADAQQFLSKCMAGQCGQEAATHTKKWLKQQIDAFQKEASSSSASLIPLPPTQSGPTPPLEQRQPTAPLPKSEPIPKQNPPPPPPPIDNPQPSSSASQLHSTPPVLPPVDYPQSFLSAINYPQLIRSPVNYLEPYPPVGHYLQPYPPSVHYPVPYPLTNNYSQPHLPPVRCHPTPATNVYRHHPISHAPYASDQSYKRQQQSSNYEEWKMWLKNKEIG